MIHRRLTRACVFAFLILSSPCMAGNPQLAQTMIAGAWEQIRNDEILVPPLVPPGAAVVVEGTGLLAGFDLDRSTDPPTFTIRLEEPEPQSDDRRSQVGMNLSGVVYWTTQWPFIDLMKWSQFSTDEQSSWEVKDADGNFLEVAGDKAGYPLGLPDGAVASTLLVRTEHYRAGTYVLTFKGKGSIWIGFDVDPSQTISSGGGGVRRALVQVPDPSASGIRIAITASDPENHIRDMRLVQEQFEHSTELFHPLFVERLQPFGVIRFMDWQRTNFTIAPRWSERSTPMRRSQASRDGVCLEYCVQLANQLDADSWLCVPYGADDEYVRNMATLIRDQLAPGLKLYLEYSNECWNYIFSQTWALQAEADDLEMNPRHLYGRRSVEIFRIFEEVFGGADRLVRVISSQAAWPDIGVQMLEGVGQIAAERGENVNDAVDALATAPYFGHSAFAQNWPLLRDSKPDEFFAQLRSDMLNNAVSWMKANQRTAEKFGLNHIAYEGGQHLANNGAVISPLVVNHLAAVNRDERMHDLYLEYLNLWRRITDGEFVGFTDVSPFTRDFAWGHLEYQDQPIADAPKYRAIVEFASQP